MADTSPQPDVACRILSDRRRRIVVALLDAEDRHFTLSELAEKVAVAEYDAPVSECTDEELRRIHSSLHHVHAPKLDEAGFVEFDADRSTVEPNDRLEALEPYRRAVEDVPDTESESDLPPLP